MYKCNQVVRKEDLYFFLFSFLFTFYTTYKIDYYHYHYYCQHNDTKRTHLSIDH